MLAGVCGAGNDARVKIDFQRALAAPEGAQEVLLVRHGACDPPATVGDLIGGRSDPSLNERGLKEAAAVTRKLSGLEIAAIFTTTLRRTGETAAGSAAEHGLEPEVVPDLVEVYLGEWEGPGIHQRGARGDAEFQRVMREQRWDLIPGAEPAAEFAARVRRGLDHVADAAGDGKVAVSFTHSAVIGECLRQASGSEPFAFLLNANGSYSRLYRMPDRRWIVASYNETDHLRE